MKIRLFFLLALALSGVSAQAKSPPKGMAVFRGLASASGITLTLQSPSVQRVNGKEAQDFYQLLRGGKNFEEVERKNLEEFRLLGESLEARGFAPLDHALSGRVFTSAQALVLRRHEDEPVSAQNGEPAYTGVMLEFSYEQIFVKKGEAPTPISVLPKTVLHGVIFLRCEPKSQGNCPISAITIHEAAVRWDYLPSSRMGGNSSAGGAGQN